MTPRTQRFIRRATTTSVVLVFVSSLVLSWSGLTHLALLAGVSPALAWLLPLVVDGTVVAGAFVVLDAELSSSSPRFGWWLTLSGAAVSVLGNVLASTGGFLSLVHALPPLALAVSLEALMRVHRQRIATAIEQAGREQREHERAERLAARSQHQSTKVASNGQAESSPSVADIQGVLRGLPGGTPRTQAVAAVLTALGSNVKARALTEALGLDPSSKADVQKVYKALSLARNQPATRPDLHLAASA